jgi:cysteine synthase A
VIVEALEGETVDVLVAAVSTTATLLGAARRLRDAFPAVRIVAVDAAGSVIFGAPPRPRDLPGIGSSRTPELLVEEEVDDVIFVDDYDSARGCRELLLGEGILAGGSSGAVIAAVQRLAPELPRGSRVVTILPDRGERYMDRVYDDDWMESRRPAVAAELPRDAAPVPTRSVALVPAP